jgi:hypothetical protein
VAVTADFSLDYYHIKQHITGDFLLDIMLPYSAYLLQPYSTRVTRNRHAQAGPNSKTISKHARY